MRSLAVVAGLLVVLAGCGGVSSDSASQSPTVTPVPGADAEWTATPPPRKVFAGATIENVTDPSVVAREHVSTLQNSTVWFTHERTVEARNGTLISRRTLDGTVEPNGSDYTLTVTRRDSQGQTTRITLQHDGRGAGRIDRSRDLPAGGPNRTVTTSTLPVDPYFRLSIERLLTAVDVDAVGKEAVTDSSGLSTTYEIRADRFRPGASLSGRNASFYARVERNGIIMLYRIRYDTVRDGTPVTVTEELDYTTVVLGRFNSTGEQ